MKRDLQIKFCGGFTLPELMTVICIVALLMTASFGAMSKARELAKKAKASAQLRELVNAWTQYLTTYKEWPNGLSGATDQEVSDNLLAPLIDAGENELGIVFLNYTPGAGSYNDPWGEPYRLSFGMKRNENSDRNKTAYETTISLPGSYILR